MHTDSSTDQSNSVLIWARAFHGSSAESSCGDLWGLGTLSRGAKRTAPVFYGVWKQTLLMRNVAEQGQNNKTRLSGPNDSRERPDSGLRNVGSQSFCTCSYGIGSFGFQFCHILIYFLHSVCKASEFCEFRLAVAREREIRGELVWK